MANVVQFTIKGIDDFSKRFGKIGPALAKVGRGVAVAVGVAGAAIAALTIRSLNLIDIQQKFADRLGVSQKALAGLEQAAKITGVSVQNIRLGLQRMTRRVAEASTGLGEAQGALKELGLSAQKLARLPVEEQFAQISERLNNVASSSDKVRLAFKLFDSEGVALINTAKLGAKGLKQMAEEAEALNLGLSRIDTAQVEAANDAITRAKDVFTGIGNVIAVQVAPFIKLVADRLFNAAKEANGFKTQIQGAFDAIIRKTEFVADAFNGLKIAIKVIELGLASFLNLVIQVGNAIQGTIVRAMGQVISQFQGLAQAAADTRLGEKLGLGAIADGLKNVENAVSAVGNGIEELAIVASNRTKEIRAELDAALLAPVPSDSIKAFAEEVKAASKLAAEEIARQSEALSTLGGGEDGGGLTAAMKKDIEGRLKALRQGLLSEEEVVRANFEKQAETLAIARENKLITDIEFHELNKELLTQRNEELKAIEDEAAKKRTDIARKEAEAKKQAIGGAFQLIGALTASENKKSFKLNKAAGLASAIVSTHTGMAKALELSYPINIIAAAVVLAKGLASINKIKGTKLSGGAQAGLENVPKTGTFLLHEGERVVRAAQNKDLTEFLRSEAAKTKQAGTVTIENVSIEVLPNATNADALLRMPDEEMREIVARPIIDALNFLDDAGIRPTFAERGAD